MLCDYFIFSIIIRSRPEVHEKMISFRHISFFHHPYPRRGTWYISGTPLKYENIVKTTGFISIPVCSVVRGTPRNRRILWKRQGLYAFLHFLGCQIPSRISGYCENTWPYKHFGWILGSGIWCPGMDLGLGLGLDLVIPIIKSFPLQNNAFLLSTDTWPRYMGNDFPNECFYFRANPF